MDHSEYMRSILDKLTESVNTGIPKNELKALGLDTAEKLHQAFPDQMGEPNRDKYLDFKKTSLFFRIKLSMAKFGEKEELAALKKDPQFQQIMADANQQAAQIHPGAKLKFAAVVSDMVRGNAYFAYQFVMTVDKRKDPAFTEQIKFFKETLPLSVKKIAAEVAPQFDTENLGFKFEMTSVSGGDEGGWYELTLNDEPQTPEQFDKKEALKAVANELMKEFAHQDRDGKKLFASNYGRDDGIGAGWQSMS